MADWNGEYISHMLSTVKKSEQVKKNYRFYPAKKF